MTSTPSKESGMDRKRDPKGIPTGGEFAARRRGESDVELDHASEGERVSQRLSEFDDAVTGRDEAEERVHHEAARALANHLRTISPDATHAFISWDDQLDQMTLTSVLTDRGFQNSSHLTESAQPFASQMPDTLPATYDRRTGEFATDPDYPYLSGSDDELVVDLAALRGPSNLPAALDQREQASERVVDTVVRHVADKVCEAYPQATHLEVEWSENCVDRTFVISPSGTEQAHRAVVTHADVMEFPRASEEDWAQMRDGLLHRIDLTAARG